MKKQHDTYVGGVHVPDTMYHVTRDEYVDKILSSGLKTNMGYSGICWGGSERVRVYHDLYGVQPIFLTSSVPYVIHEMLGLDWFLEKNCWVFRVDVRTLKVESEIDYFNDYTFIHRNNIPLSRLQIEYKPTSKIFPWKKELDRLERMNKIST